MIKYSYKSKLKEKSFTLAHSSRILSILVGMSWQQELEGADDVHNQERGRDECVTAAQFLFSIAIVQYPSPREW